MKRLESPVCCWSCNDARDRRLLAPERIATTREESQRPPPSIPQKEALARYDSSAGLDLVAPGPGWLRPGAERRVSAKKFIGWRLVSSPIGMVGPEPGSGHRVNGTALDRPDDLWTAGCGHGPSEIKIAFDARKTADTWELRRAEGRHKELEAA